MPEKKPGQDPSITISAPVTLEFDQRVRVAVAQRRLPSKAEAIRQALRFWLAADPCPVCDAPTIPDARQPGVRYCLECQDATLYRPDNGDQDQ